MVLYPIESLGVRDRCVPLPLTRMDANGREWTQVTDAVDVAVMDTLESVLKIAAPNLLK